MGCVRRYNDAIEYAVSSILMMITIIGIPFGLQTLKLARVALWPFGSDIVDAGWPSGCLAGVMNVIWWFGGIPIVLTHLAWGVIFCIARSGHTFRPPAFQTDETRPVPLRDGGEVILYMRLNRRRGAEYVV